MPKALDAGWYSSRGCIFTGLQTCIITDSELMLSNIFAYCRFKMVSSHICVLAGVDIFASALRLTCYPSKYTFFCQFISLYVAAFCFGVTDLNKSPVSTGACLCMILLELHSNSLLSTVTWKSPPALLPGLFSACTIWASSALYLLDWNKSWQQWPCPTVCGTALGTILSHFVCALIREQKYDNSTNHKKRVS